MDRPFENANVGDVVYHLAYGYGIITYVDRDTLVYRPSTAKNRKHDIWINKDGFMAAWYSNIIKRVLYWKEPLIIEQ